MSTLKKKKDLIEAEASIRRKIGTGQGLKLPKMRKLIQNAEKMSIFRLTMIISQ